MDGGFDARLRADPTLATELQLSGLSAAVRRSPDFARCLPALVRAQRAFKPVEKTTQVTESVRDQDTGRYESRSYMAADLPHVLAACIPALNEQGFFFSQSTAYSTDAGWVLLTELLHETGAWIASYVPIPDPRTKADPQEFAADLTLYRRYGACPLLGIAPEEQQKVGVYKDAAKPAKGKGKEAAAAAAPAPAAAEPPPPPPEPPAPPPPPDLADPRVRADATRKLNAALIEVASREPGERAGAGREVWAAHEATLRAMKQGELDIVVDNYRKRVRSEPPEIEGLRYPELAER